MPDPRPGDVTRMLVELRGGNEDVVSKLMPVLYNELRRLAARYLRRERANHTLQPTALVNEAYLKLVDQRDVEWQNRAHFFGLAAQAMRRILVDHARAHVADKRGGGAARVTLNESVAFSEDATVDVLAVHEALERLTALDPQHARIVELRFFGGLTNEAIAEVIGISVATVKRDWRVARAWLHRELTGGRS